MSYIYSLRYALQPERDNEERIKNLLTFCENADIDEINFFVNHEEINRGHLTLEKNEKWVSLCKELKSILAKKKIRFSINPGTTLMHGDRGRVLDSELHFQTMVDASGTQAKAVACPLDPIFQEYISDIYAQLAKAEPDLLWVEDDIRHHNHKPVNWGCFCDKHMEEYSKRIGHKVKREEFVEGILKEGDPHPYRKIYMDMCQEEIINIFSKMHKKVKEVSPNTKMALMTSQPPQHSVEGRDWNEVLDVLCGSDVRVTRPHLPSYNEVTPKVYSNEFNSYVRTASILIGENSEIYPELENYMYSRYAKSNRFTEMQLKTSLVMNPVGSTMNLFDMMGTGVNFDDGLDTLLKNIKPYLSKMKSLDLKVKNQKGIVCLFHQQASYNIHTESNTREALIPHETMWLELLSAFGIACVACDQIDDIKNEIVAVSGQYFRNVSNEQIEKLFKDNYIMLDGESCAILKERNLLHLIHATDGKWSEVRAGYQTYEQVDNGDIVGGVKEARMTLMQQVGDLFMINYDDSVKIITNAYNEYQELLSPACCQTENAFILPIKYHDIHRWNAQYIGFKEHLIKLALRRIDGRYRKAIWVDCVPFTNMVYYEQDNKHYFYLLNFSTDTYSDFQLNGISFNKIYRVDESGNHEVPFNKEKVNCPIGYLDVELFIVEND